MISKRILPTALAFVALVAIACGSKEKAPAPSGETAAPAAAAPAEAGCGGPRARPQIPVNSAHRLPEFLKKQLA